MPQAQATMNRFIVQSQAKERNLIVLSPPKTENEEEDQSTPSSKNKHINQGSYKAKLEGQQMDQEAETTHINRSSIKRNRKELPSPIYPTGNNTLDMDISYDTDQVSDQQNSPAFGDAEFFTIKVPQNSSEKYGLNMDDDKELQLPSSDESIRTR